jgi:hypothetical protein
MTAALAQKQRAEKLREKKSARKWRAIFSFGAAN